MTVELEESSQKTEVEDRVEATKKLAKIIWFIIFFPFGLIGALLGFREFLIGISAGLLIFILILLDMRYGNEPK